MGDILDQKDQRGVKASLLRDLDLEQVRPARSSYFPLYLADHTTKYFLCLRRTAYCAASGCVQALDG